MTESFRSTRATSSSGASAIAPATTASATNPRANQRSLRRLTGGDLYTKSRSGERLFGHLRNEKNQNAVTVRTRAPTRAVDPFALPRSVTVCAPAGTFRMTKNGTLFQAFVTLV